MTVKMATKVWLFIRRIEAKLGNLFISIGKWFIRGCKPQPDIYKRSNGVIHTLPCAGDFYILEGGVALIACTSNLASLPEMVRIVSEDITNLARALEEVENV